MKLIKIAKILLILAMPFLLFLLAVNLLIFDEGFYQEKLTKYGVTEKIPNAFSLHEEVINFLKGRSDELPDVFNDREKSHFFNVRDVVKASTIIFYALIAMFILLLSTSIFTLKINNYITNFIGKVLFFGGVLTIALALILFLLISFDFSPTFESFHLLLFEKGTYLFDPANEMIVNLYPEQLFMDIGLRISKWVILASAIVILAGWLLIFKSKSKRNKNNKKSN